MAVDHAALSQTLQQLDVPEEFNCYETTDDAQLIVRLEAWKQKACTVLAELRETLRERDTLTSNEQAEIVARLAQFECEAPWVLDASRKLAQEILEPYADVETQLIETILTNYVKAVFKLSSHPKVSQATGRALDRVLGGEAGAHDYYEGQVWKRHPGLINVLDWCIRHLKTTAFEKLWPLVVPPVMTLLDDYEVKYKLLGIPVVDHLLDNAPGELLRRTGINGLLLTSFKTGLTFLRSPETPCLIRGIARTWLKLTERTTLPESAERFEQLWALLGEGIIETVWVYGFDAPDSIQASIEVLPDVVRALGLGATRYLKALVLQLVHPLIPGPENPATIAFQIASLRALDVVIAECAPRMPKWKGTILDAVCRCWVNLVESRADNTDARELKAALRGTCGSLARLCPSVTKEEFRHLLEMDGQIFKDLVTPYACSSDNR